MCVSHNKDNRDSVKSKLYVPVPRPLKAECVTAARANNTILTAWVIAALQEKLNRDSL